MSTDQHKRDLKTAALDYVGQGWAVFAVIPYGKRPHPTLAPNGHRSATTDPKEIERIWTEEPDANIGLSLVGSGLVAVDVDSYHEACGWDDFIKDKKLPPTLVQKSGRGGTHYIYSCGDDERFAGSFAGVDKVDIKHLGYILVEPSIVDGKAYEWQNTFEVASRPGWLPKMRTAGGASLDGMELDTDPAIERATNYLRSGAPEAVSGAGGNNATYQVACRVKDYGISEDTCLDLMADHWNDKKAVPPWSMDELAGVIKNAFQYGRGATGMVAPELEFDAVPDPVPPWPTPFSPAAMLSIPPRAWIYGRHLIRGFASGTIAPGGVGKSSLTLTEAMAVATGEPLLGVEVYDQCKVWVWNGEDPNDEVLRRTQGVMIEHGITDDDLVNRLFLDSGRDTPIKLVTEEDRRAVVMRKSREVEERIGDEGIGLVVMDPFVAIHGVEENHNNAINLVMQTIGRIAERTGCAFELVHHSGKVGKDGTVTVDSARGASAYAWALRSLRVVSPMSEDEAELMGFTGDRYSHIKVFSAKANMAKREALSQWYELKSVKLPNGDTVSAVTQWRPPATEPVVDEGKMILIAEALDPDGSPSDVRSPDWAGRVVADALGLAIEGKPDRKVIGSLLDQARKAGAVALVRRHDGRQGRERAFYIRPTDMKDGDEILPAP